MNNVIVVVIKTNDDLATAICQNIARYLCLDQTLMIYHSKLQFWFLVHLWGAGIIWNLTATMVHHSLVLIAMLFDVHASKTRSRNTGFIFYPQYWNSRSFYETSEFCEKMLYGCKNYSLELNEFFHTFLSLKSDIFFLDDVISDIKSFQSFTVLCSGKEIAVSINSLWAILMKIFKNIEIKYFLDLWYESISLELILNS